MLLLLTIGLVLVATVALVIGFVTSALAPIYVSIACSVGAALVLFLFSRMSKRDVVVTTAAGPAPLPGPTVVSDAPASTVTVLGSAAPPEARGEAPAADASEAASDSEAAGVPAEGVSAMSGEAFAPEGFAEPPAPAALAGAEQDAAAESERASGAPEPVTATWGPTEAANGAMSDMDATGEVEAVNADGASSAEVFALADAGTPQDDQGAPAPTGVEGDEDVIFPIAEYDDLRVSEILPLLPELDEDELEMVRDREQQGRARFSILTRIDQLTRSYTAGAASAPSQGFEEDAAGTGVVVSGAGATVPAAEPPAFGQEAESANGLESAVAPVAAAPTPDDDTTSVFAPPAGEAQDAERQDAAIADASGPEGAGTDAVVVGAAGGLDPAAAADAAGVVDTTAPVARAFPIADYEQRKVTEILPLLTNLDAGDLAQVYEREQRGKARGSVLVRIEQLQARAAESPAVAVAGAPAAAQKATAQKSTARASTAKTASAAKTATAAKTASTAKKAPAKKAPAKKAAPTTAAKKTPAKSTKAAKTTKGAASAPSEAGSAATNAANAAKASDGGADGAPAKKAPSRTTKKQS